MSDEGASHVHFSPTDSNEVFPDSDNHSDNSNYTSSPTSDRPGHTLISGSKTNPPYLEQAIWPVYLLPEGLVNGALASIVGLTIKWYESVHALFDMSCTITLCLMLILPAPWHPPWQTISITCFHNSGPTNTETKVCMHVLLCKHHTSLSASYNVQSDLSFMGVLQDISGFCRTLWSHTRSITPSFWSLHSLGTTSNAISQSIEQHTHIVLCKWPPSSCTIINAYRLPIYITPFWSLL